MAKPELGTKRVCVSCGAKFYDLMKVPAVCPKCGTEQPAELPKARRLGGNVIDDKRPKKAAAADDVDVETEAAEDESEEGVPEDANELDDDADAIPDEIEVEPDAEEVER
jgi:uncharacterized protein (TIGR02300 family)